MSGSICTDVPVQPRSSTRIKTTFGCSAEIGTGSKNNAKPQTTPQVRRELALFDRCEASLALRDVWSQTTKRLRCMRLGRPRHLGLGRLASCRVAVQIPKEELGGKGFPGDGDLCVAGDRLRSNLPNQARASRRRPTVNLVEVRRLLFRSRLPSRSASRQSDTHLACLLITAQ